jgi:uncharacterized membrane protein
VSIITICIHQPGHTNLFFTFINSMSNAEEKQLQSGKSMTNSMSFGPDVTFALLSGMSAAGASLFGKLALEERTVAIASHVQTMLARLGLEELLDMAYTVWLTRALFIGGMIAANAAMWAFFTLSLNRTSSSARVTVINSCANFCFTAIFGHLCFGEPLALRWWFGAALMAAGGVLVAQPTDNTKAMASTTPANDEDVTIVQAQTTSIKHQRSETLRART